MVDRYTKVVLSVIAFALLTIAAQNFLKPAKAQMTEHVIVDSVGSYAFQYAGPLSVRVQNY